MMDTCPRCTRSRRSLPVRCLWHRPVPAPQGRADQGFEAESRRGFEAKPRHSPFVVGVDGGSTKTIALAADANGRILGAGRSGNCNWYTVGKAGATSAVSEAVHMALEEGGLVPEQISFAFYSITGADWPEDQPMLAELLGTLGLSQRLAAQNDVFAALRSGTADPYGVVICAGTGTNTAVVAPDGRKHVYGFWVDYGGAGSLARDAIRAVLRAADGRGQPTALTERLLAHFGVLDPEALLRSLVRRAINQATILTVCPLVFEAATDDDPVASALIVHMAHELALYATAGIRRLDMTGLSFDVVLSGSLFKGRGSLLIDTIREDVLKAAPGARVVRPRFEAAVGAVILALEALDVPIDDAMLQHLAETQPEPKVFATHNCQVEDFRRSSSGARQGQKQ
jgi:N-acetylglucosamine kinase-like BadF-type ATPase